MPADTVAETALVVMATALSVQTLLLIVVVIGATVAWRRLAVSAEAGYRELSARVDAAAHDARQAAQAVSRLSDRASNALGQAGQVVGTVSSAISAPKTLLAAGAVTALSRLASALRKRRARRALERGAPE